MDKIDELIDSMGIPRGILLGKTITPDDVKEYRKALDMLPNEDYYENRKKLTAAIDRIVAACGCNQGVDEAIESFKADFPSGTAERMIFTVGELSGHRHSGKTSLPATYACPNCAERIMDRGPDSSLICWRCMHRWRPSA